MRTWLLVALFSLALGGCQQSAVPAESGRETLLSVDVVEMSVRDLLGYVSHEAKVEIVLVPADLDRRISLTLDKRALREVLDAIAEQAGCAVREESPNRLIVEKT